MPNLSLIIPCHNEAEAIPEVLRSLAMAKKRLLESGLITSLQVIVVDDASTDGTPELLREFTWIETVRLFSQSGYGSALKTGFARATGDWIAFIDLDGTYDPADLEILLQEFSKGDAEFLLGERFSAGEGMPIIRNIGNQFFTLLVRKLYKKKITDVCTGYRVFRNKWIEPILDLPNDGLDFSLAITLWTIKNKVPFREVPIRYHVRSGQSKLRIIADGFCFLKTIFSAHSSFAKLP